MEWVLGFGKGDQFMDPRTEVIVKSGGGEGGDKPDLSELADQFRGCPTHVSVRGQENDLGALGVRDFREMTEDGIDLRPARIQDRDPREIGAFHLTDQGGEGEDLQLSPPEGLSTHGCEGG